MPRKTIAKFEVEYLQILDENGKVDKALLPKIPKETLLKMYKVMVLTRIFDAKLLSLQRQGRIGTFAQVKGQEGCQVGVLSCLNEEDWIIPAFREWAAFIYRDVPLKNMIIYNGGDERGSMLGHNILPISIPVGSQTLHATGIAWGMKLKKKDNVAVCFFGDGATSEGDFHAALNFASVYKVPCVFICQNNQYAISIPVTRQTGSETIAQKGIAYGMHCIKVDGNDVFAVHLAVKEAVERAKKGEGPSLIECFTYRLADHTTSDDAKRYRKEEEVKEWEKKDPIPRLKNYLEKEKLWTKKDEEQLQKEVQEKIEAAVKEAEETGIPPLEDMFKYTYEKMTPQLEEQLEYIKQFEQK